MIAVSISILMILSGLRPSLASEETSSSFDRIVESTLKDNKLDYKLEKYDLSNNDWEVINKELSYNGYLNKLVNNNFQRS